MGYCSVSNCCNHSGGAGFSSKGITFHRFPKEPEIKEKWILATGKKDWFPNKYSVICSAHFKEDDFNPNTKTRIVLKHAIPTVAVWMNTDGNVTGNEETASTSSSPSSSSKQVKLMEDTNAKDTKIIRKLKHIILVKDDVIKKQRTKIKCLKMKYRRCNKKILALIDIIKEMKSKMEADGSLFKHE